MLSNARLFFSKQIGVKAACAVQSDTKPTLSSQRSVQCFYVISLSGDYFYLNRTLIYISLYFLSLIWSTLVEWPFIVVIVSVVSLIAHMHLYTLLWWKLHFTSCKDQGLYRLSLFQLRKGPDLSTCAVSQHSRNASHCFHCRQNGDVPFFLLHSHSLFIATVVCCHVVNPPRVTLTWLYLDAFSRNVYLTCWMCVQGKSCDDALADADFPQAYNDYAQRRSVKHWALCQ